MTVLVLVVQTLPALAQADRVFDGSDNTNRNEASSNAVVGTVELGLSFPPMADSSQLVFTQQEMTNLGVSLLRFDERWADREPTEDAYNWAPLDARMQFIANNGYTAMMTIVANGPAWACSGVSNPQSCVNTDNNDFKQYIEDLLQRYPNQLAKIQYGNEWTTPFWYVGSEVEFVVVANILYTAVQTYSPQTEVVLGGISIGGLRLAAACNGYLAGETLCVEGTTFNVDAFQATECGMPANADQLTRLDYVFQNANYDLVDLHLYDDPEYWSQYVAAVNDLYNDVNPKPIIISEFGGPDLLCETYSDQYQADRLEVYILKIANDLNVREAYFFRLVQDASANPIHVESGLMKEVPPGSGTVVQKPAYSVFQTYVPLVAPPDPPVSMVIGTRLTLILGVGFVLIFGLRFLTPMR
ncbi:MAG: hypothetical protein COA73_11000 [Candidatus Hydrogenedentota bacterium]|nr:MAG: hypothetical protein COA73_11000 [Candidatus Hydrogenedentota bacterium]